MFYFNKYRRLFQASPRYYMARSVRAQGEPNTPLVLATQMCHSTNDELHSLIAA